MPAKYVIMSVLFVLLFACESKEYVTEDRIDFNFHIKPILSDRCFSCHGPDANKREADLRLDTEEGALKTLLSSGKKAFVAGKVHRSEAVLRIRSDDPDFLMPPPGSKLVITEEEIVRIEKWIEQGANYQDHWAFVSVNKPKIPVLPPEWKVNNPIDQFIGKKLEEHGQTFEAQAHKETLIRRLSFALKGLPPKADEVDAFLKDSSENAYKTHLDKYLASPHYGERMAAFWMDVARFTDSDGYLDDKHRDFSPWRDWVIEAFNKNMPYDQFIAWQLAGDVLPGAGKEATLATAFNRLHKKNSEAGIVFEEYRSEYVADRTNTLGKAFLGLTLECARCHDHKYDPISQKEYYELFGYFNSTFEIGTATYGPGQVAGPSLMLSNKETDAQKVALEKLIKETENRLKHVGDMGFEDWLREKPIGNHIVDRLAEHIVADHPFDDFLEKRPKYSISPNTKNSQKPAELREPIVGEGKQGQAIYFNEFNSVKLGEKIAWFDRTDPFSFSFWFKADTVYNNASLLYHAEELRLGLKGYSLILNENRLQFVLAHTFPQNAIAIQTKDPIPLRKWTHITATYDGSSKAEGMKIFFNGEEVGHITQYDHLYKSILYKADIHTYGFQGLVLGNRSKFTAMERAALDQFKVYKTELHPAEVAFLYDGSLPHATADKNNYFRAKHALPAVDGYVKLQALREEENQLTKDVPEIMVLGDLPEPRPTFVLDRGNYDQHGQEVFPTTPIWLAPSLGKNRQNRQDLIQWLIHPDHPLTARVVVNHIWQMHFGTGLVKTADDFGAQGSLPSHPELLDWLAVWFVEAGWDLKALHHLILSSATYQQSSISNQAKKDWDPENRMLARGPSFRLPAEMIRDQALVASGRMVNKIGGKSVYPYQPQGLWDEISNKSWRYPYLQKAGEGLYRRSLYTIWKRTAPPPSMLIFDIADRDNCTVKRRQTSTPLQALVLLNDPQFLEAARELASKSIIEGGKELVGQIQFAFRALTARYPDDQEIEVMVELYEQEKERFEKEKAAMEAYLSIGELDINANILPLELASMASVVHAIMNTVEAYTLM